MKTMSSKNIVRGKNWKLIIYSKPGQGKTSSIKYLKGKTLVLDLDHSSSVLSGLPNVDLYRYDDGTDEGREFNRNSPSDDLAEFLRDSKEISKQYDNVVIDNISSLEKDWFVERGRSSKNGISNEIQDYSQWTNFFARIMTAVYMIPNVNVITTAWETQRDVTTETGQTFSQYAPLIRTSVLDGLLGLADVVGRLVINPKTGGRGVILEGNDGIYAKNRLDERTVSPIEELFDFGSIAKEAPKTESKKEEPKTTKAGNN